MNINEIARRAGVSRATVSRYLNNGYVSAQKRTLIANVIDETGYTPSHTAQQLRLGRTGLVGVIIPKVNSQSVGRMVEGITEKLHEGSYETILANTSNDPSKEVDYLRLLNEKNRVDGIILLGTRYTEAHKKAVSQLGIPLVVLNQRFEECRCVYQDDYHAIRDVSALALANAKHAAYLGPPEYDDAAGRQRKQGFVDACKQAGMLLDKDALQTVGFDADSGYFGAERLLNAIPSLDTIVCATDSIAFGAMMCMVGYGRRVPHDVQITGLGDSLLSRISRPSLTTVHMPYKTTGIRGAEVLLTQMDSCGAVANASNVLMPYEVFVRNSLR